MNPYYGDAMGACGPFGCGPGAGLAGPNPYYGYGAGYGGWGSPNLAIMGQEDPGVLARNIQMQAAAPGAQGDAPAADNRTFTEKTSDWLNTETAGVKRKWWVVGGTALGLGVYGYSQGWWLSGRDQDEESRGEGRDRRGRNGRSGRSAWFGDSSGSSSRRSRSGGRDGGGRGGRSGGRSGRSGGRSSRERDFFF